MGVKITFDSPPNREPTVRVEAVGYTGKSCETATARIIRALRLGPQLTDQKKPEYYDDVVADEPVTEGQG